MLTNIENNVTTNHSSNQIQINTSHLQSINSETFCTVLLFIVTSYTLNISIESYCTLYIFHVPCKTQYRRDSQIRNLSNYFSNIILVEWDGAIKIFTIHIHFAPYQIYTIDGAVRVTPVVLISACSMEWSAKFGMGLTEGSNIERYLFLLPLQS